MRLRNQVMVVVVVLAACGKATTPDDPVVVVPAEDAGTAADAGQVARADGGFDAGFDGGQDGGQDGGLRYHPVGWNVPDAGAFHGQPALQGLADCTGCHGPTLTGGTVAVSCDQCHSGWKTNCTFCHGGTDNPTGAPPRDVLGRTATTEVSVGAHTSHVQVSRSISSPLNCAACHPTTADALTPGHIDPSPAELTLTGWTRGSASCAVYCHGVFAGGTGSNAPFWTQLNGTQSACGTCHALPPSTGAHPNKLPKHSFMGSNCTSCHLDANSTGSAITRPELHVNGVKDVAVIGGTWNANTLTCDPACHGPERW